jgi:hypothetical protein
MHWNLSERRVEQRHQGDDATPTAPHAAETAMWITVAMRLTVRVMAVERADTSTSR